jgi:hypothetical protein
MPFALVVKGSAPGATISVNVVPLALIGCIRVVADNLSAVVDPSGKGAVGRWSIELCEGIGLGVSESTRQQ